MTKETIIKKILASKKYNSVYPKTVERVVDSVSKRFSSKDWEMESRKLLHQVWGMYIDKIQNIKKIKSKNKKETFNSLPIWESLSVRQVGTRASDESAQLELISLLGSHSSTKERLPIAEKFFESIFKITGTPESIIDHACGLNPLFLPIMKLPEDVKYTAYDIDIKEIETLNSIAEKYNLNFKAEVGDILIDKFPRADVVFLFKALPVLELQEKNSTVRVIENIDANSIVVSYPIKSVSGKEKNMKSFYSNFFETKAKESGWKFDRIDFENEIVYVVKR